MREHSIREYIAIGVELEFLRHVKVGTPVHGRDSVSRVTRHLVEDLDEYNLKVTRGCAQRLEDLVEEMRIKKMAKLDERYAKSIAEAALFVADVSYQEVSTYTVFILNPKRYDLRHLLGECSALFAPTIFSKLPEIAKSDFEEAGKCIAFERPTAAAFHLLRATESILKELYCKIVRRGREKLLWGNMVAHLRRRRLKELKVFLDHLDHIRENFRNPTAHPDKIFDINEVQDLCGVCIDVANRMISSRYWA